MIHAPTTFFAVAGTAFVLASYAPAALEAQAMRFQDAAMTASLDARASAPRERAPALPSASGRGDRLSAPRPEIEPRERVAVQAVEIVGLAQAAVILRDRDGAVLFRSDPLAGVTVVAKGADLPVVTLREAPAPQPTPEPSVQGLSPKREGQEAPNPGRRPRTVGCETALSPLVRGGAQQAPGRCLAQATSRTAS